MTSKESNRSSACCFQNFRKFKITLFHLHLILAYSVSSKCDQNIAGNVDQASLRGYTHGKTGQKSTKHQAQRRGVTRLDGVRSKKHVWRSQVRT